MADPEENYLAARLEEDRRGMAQAVSELQNDYDIPQRLNASIRQYPWAWVFGAALIGWLLSRLPARRREVYIFKRHSEDKNPPEVRMVSARGRKSDIGKSVWSFTQPMLSTYLARELHKRIGRPRELTPSYGSREPFVNRSSPDKCSERSRTMLPDRKSHPTGAKRERSKR
jgi:hypothetical protein